MSALRSDEAEPVGAAGGSGSGFTLAGTDQLLAEGLAYEPVHGRLYRTLNGELTTAALTSGAFTPNELAGPPQDLEGLAWRDDGRLYGLGRESSSLFAYDIIGDTWSIVGDTGIADHDAFGLAWDPVADVLYSINAAGDVHRIDPDTAVATPSGTYTISGSCTVGDETIALPTGTTVLGAVVDPPPPSQGPIAVPVEPTFVG